MDRTNEENYWRQHHHKQAFAKPDRNYEHYAAAYRTGYEGFEKHPGKKFEDVQADLAVAYDKHKSALPWDDAKEATRAAWDKLSGVTSARDVSRGVRYD